MKAYIQKYLPTPRANWVDFWNGTLEWTCVWNRLEMTRKAAVPTSHVLVLLQIEDVIDGLWQQ